MMATEMSERIRRGHIKPPPFRKRSCRLNVIVSLGRWSGEMVWKRQKSE